ncbi:dipeptidase [Oceanobacillus alkalisoli]|uniref:dipeptidase n=1 Tax=Oceanobacillus alkalisoli TaxID=2925113 RepID=UPI001F11D84C|nr:dipeptidase [Oceanobacillus alkalisoli]MCF3944576.1 dipeptidase [Oceanobacillus alkalisoli]
MKKSFLFLLFLVICFLHPTNISYAALPHLKATDPVSFDPPIVDSHNDTMMKIVDENTWLPVLDIGEDTALELDIPKAKEGGLDVAFFAAFTAGYQDNNPRAISRTLALINALFWTADHHSEAFEIARDTEAIKQTIKDGKLAAVPTIEGAYSLEEHNAIELVRQYHDLGVKVIGFNWNYSNALGEGADQVYGDPANTTSNGGLTELGAAVIKEMNRLGMAVDVSHMARTTFADTIKVTKAPIIASHSGVNAIKEHQRNLTDEEMLALKENGGILSIVFYPAFLTDNANGYVTDIVDHIDYAVEVMGIDHVGLGSDFDGAVLPVDLQTAADLPNITEELVYRGYSLEDIEKVLGGNMLRVLEEIEEVSEMNEHRDGTGPEVQLDFEMGEAFESRTPLLEAKIAEADFPNINQDNLHVIIDGVAYEADFDEKSGKLSFKVKDKLQEKFHVVTFEAESNDGGKTRETRIVYISE